jgi:hypothetical protein
VTKEQGMKKPNMKKRDTKTKRPAGSTTTPVKAALGSPVRAGLPKTTPHSPTPPRNTSTGISLDTTDDAAFFLWHGTDGIERPGQPGHHLLPDGRLILPLMLDLPRICLYRRCRRAKTCTRQDMPCAIGFHIEIAEQRFNWLDRCPEWRQKRWATIAGPDAPRPPGRTGLCAKNGAAAKSGTEGRGRSLVP